VHVIAGASPDNTPAGYYWTFLFPMLLFIVIALILWALFGRPHQRVPAGRIRLGLGSPGAAVTAAAAAAAAPGGTGNGGAATGGAAPTASAEPAPAAGSEQTDGGQPGADGAGAGE
jgi:hypothetical protein